MFAVGIADCQFTCNGIYNFMGNGGFYVSNNGAGQQATSDWVYRAPKGTFVSKALLSGLYHNNSATCGLADSSYRSQGRAAICSKVAIGIARGDSSGGWDGTSGATMVSIENNVANQANPQYENPYSAVAGYANYSAQLCAPPAGNPEGCEGLPPSSKLTDGNAVVYRIGPNAQASRFVQAGAHVNVYARMDYAIILLADRNAPSITSPRPGAAIAADAPWIDDGGQQRTVTASARDLGSGVSTISLDGIQADSDPETEAITKSAGCQPDTSTGTCDSPRTTFAYGLSEGVNAITLTAKDKFGADAKPQTSYQRIDRSAPRLSSLELIETATNRAVDVDRDSLTASQYTLRFDASDGVSGIQEIEVLVDEQLVTRLTATQRQWTFRAPRCLAWVDLGPPAAGVVR